VKKSDPGEAETEQVALLAKLVKNCLLSI